jgi:menaquinone-specific isochorismate synthase
MVVPQTVIVRRGGTTRRITIGEGSPAVAAPVDAPETTAVDAADPSRSSDRPRYAGSTVRDDVWLEAVAKAVAAIDGGAYEKVVLARDLHLWSKRPFAVPQLLADLAARFPSCMTFLVDHLLGASPELLVRRTGSHVASRVLAGTARRGEDAAEDEAIGAALLASTKDRHEHDLALRSAVDALAPLCVDARGARGTGARAARQRAAPRHGPGRDTGPDDHQHVGGRWGHRHARAGAPRAPAPDRSGRRCTARGGRRGDPRRSRGCRGAATPDPVGWCTPDGDGEFAIALRCAEVRGARARLFAGAGIVAGSLPEAELTETWLKLRAMTGVLDR